MIDDIIFLGKPHAIMPSRKLFKYSEKQMEDALNAIANGMSKREAARNFNVPRTTLLEKFTGRSPLERKIGHPTVLTSKEETEVIE